MEQAAQRREQQGQQSPGLFRAQGFLPVDSQGKIHAAQQCRSVSLCFCDTEAEQQAAEHLSSVWRGLHLAGLQQSEDGRQAGDRYAEEEEVLQRLRSTVTLTQLRSLLADLRDSGELARLADSTAAAAADSGLAGGAASAPADGRRAIRGPAAGRLVAAWPAAQRTQAVEPSDTEGEEDVGEDGSLARQYRRAGVNKLQVYTNLPVDNLPVDSGGQLLSTASNQVRLLYCATPEERAVAEEVAHVWQELQLDSSEAGRAHSREEVMAKYQEEQQLIQRLQGVTELDQLRFLLRDLRDSGELVRLAGSTAAGAAHKMAAASGQHVRQQPRESICRVRLGVKVDTAGVPDASQPSKQFYLIKASTPAEVALAQDLVSAWRAAHGKGVRTCTLLQGQVVQRRLSQALPELLCQVLDARTVLQLQDCLRSLNNSGELGRAAARLNSGGTGGAVGAQRSTAQEAPAPRPADVDTPRVMLGQGGDSGQLLPVKRDSPSAAGQGSGAPPSKRAAAGGSSPASLGATAAASASVDGGQQGIAVVSAKAATCGQDAQWQQRQQQEQQQQQPQRQQQQQPQQGRFSITLKAKADAGGVPNASLPSKQWYLITASTPAEAALARDLKWAWRAAHGKGMQEDNLLQQGREAQERLSQALPALLHQVLDATTILQLRECLKGLKNSGELRRAAAQLGSGGAAEAMGAQRSTAQQAAAPRREEEDGEGHQPSSRQQIQQPEEALGTRAEAAGAAEEPLLSTEQQVAAVEMAAAGPLEVAVAAAPALAAAPAAGVLRPAESAAVGSAAAGPEPAAPAAAGTYSVKLLARVNQAGEPDTSQASTTVELLSVPLIVEALAAQALACIWRTELGATVNKQQLKAGREELERFDQVVPELVQQVQAAPGVFQLRGCLQSLHESGQLWHAARLLNLKPNPVVATPAAAAGTAGAVVAFVPTAASPARAVRLGGQQGPTGGPAIAAVTAGAEQPAAGEAVEQLPQPLQLPQQLPATEKMETEPPDQLAVDGRNGCATPGLAESALDAPAVTVSPSEGLGTVQTGWRKRGSTTAVHASDGGPPRKRHVVAQRTQQTAAAQPDPGPVAGTQQCQQQQQQAPGHTPWHGSHSVPGQPAAGPAAQQPPAEEPLHAPTAAPGPSAAGSNQSSSLLLRLLAACEDEQAQAAGLTPATVSSFMAAMTLRCGEVQRRESAEWVVALLCTRKFEAVRIIMEQVVKVSEL